MQKASQLRSLLLLHHHEAWALRVRVRAPQLPGGTGARVQATAVASPRAAAMALCMHPAGFRPQGSPEVWLAHGMRLAAGEETVVPAWVWLEVEMEGRLGLTGPARHSRGLGAPSCGVMP